jgi:hypothetical protein
VRNPTFVTLSDGTIRNTYDLRCATSRARTSPFHTAHLIPVTDCARGDEDQTRDVPANETLSQRVYV